MPAALPTAVQLPATAALVAWMVTGFTRSPGRWMRYLLFSRATFVITDLTGTKDGHSEPDAEWERLRPFLPVSNGRCGTPPRRPLRLTPADPCVPRCKASSRR
ncbi:MULTISPECIES: hypothetical protein [Streptomyces]|uniref:Uncharacterized protein n=1 Tax=Streptomyces sviceus (strain ATCC 29083 / DSM 924 / JCM 4929 / NBRC 13980 / NCIMB 11184 / NRRL 5439 / UC 5370) TaxID=463191 RepID=B5HRW2_STRX2|nr:MULTISPECIES: hypothetical protein [Streptomyces]EDY55567.1 conserved hypothetical protein [Streptomyces sviceus ATCC 29083]MYT03184.1 hypothetical protein [Streptomyces sp. SID5470]